jgi:hypothetical protein
MVLAIPYNRAMSRLEEEGPLTTEQVEERFRKLFGREMTAQERMVLMLPPLPKAKSDVAQ